VLWVTAPAAITAADPAQLDPRIVGEQPSQSQMKG
jgi:hypothetical protein